MNNSSAFFRTILLSTAFGGILGASPFLGWVYFSEKTKLGQKDNSKGSTFDLGLTRRIAEIVTDYNSKTWKSGVYRPKRIILLRHGQTHGYSHTCDCQVAGLPVCALKPEVMRPLTEEGKLQSLQAGVALKRIIGDESVTFYSSPYTSCKQTFAYVAGSFEDKDACMYVEDPRLRNQDFGDWHQKESTEKNEKFLKQAERIGKFYYRWPNGENGADVYDRTSSFMETMYRKWKHHDRPDNFVLITHGSVMNAFLMRWFHWDVETFNRLGRFKNGQLAVMEKQKDGSYKLITPLPCRPPIPDGVKLLAENPQSPPGKAAAAS